MFRFLMCKIMVIGCLVVVTFPQSSFSQQPVNQQKDQSPEHIVVLNPKTGGRTKIAGQIVDFNGEELALKVSPTKGFKLFAAEQIVETHYQQTTAHQKAVELLNQKKYTDADAEIEIALKLEPREWVRRELLALQVRMALALYDYEKAGNRFIALCASDPQTRHFALIPLDWTVSTRHLKETSQKIALSKMRNVPRSASRWLKSADPVSQLLGASWMLFAVDDPELVIRRLNILARNKNTQIHQYAQMQNWRLYIAQKQYDESQLSRWEKRIEGLPSDQRAGPYYLLGTAFVLRLEHDHAAVRRLWLKSVNCPDFALSTQAQVEAAESLVQLGLSKEAKIVYRELVERFPNSPAAKYVAEKQKINRNIKSAP